MRAVVVAAVMLAAVSSVAAPASADPADCLPHPPPDRDETCAPPSAEVIARLDRAAAKLTGHKDLPADGIWSCSMAGTYLAEVRLAVKPGMTGVAKTDCATPDECYGYATFRVPATGEPVQVPPTQVLPPRDVDGDGTPETVSADPKGRVTVWFAAGKHRVVMPKQGAFVPLDKGDAWLDADGDAVYGFVRATAHAYRLTAAGAVDSIQLRDELWAQTVAGRCPEQDVIEAQLSPDIAAPPAPPTAPACTAPNLGPSNAVRTKLAAQITTEITDHVRARGRHLIGPPAMQWSCNPRELAAAVTYCESAPGGSCAGGSPEAKQHLEIWTGGGAHVSALDRQISQTLVTEYAIVRSRSIIANVDVDGDGRPDPIFDLVAHEGGSSADQHTLQTFVAGRLVPFFDATLHDDTTLELHAIPHGLAVVVHRGDADGQTAGASEDKLTWSAASHRLTHVK